MKIYKLNKSLVIESLNLLRLNGFEDTSVYKRLKAISEGLCDKDSSCRKCNFDCRFEKFDNSDKT
jgi:hypothetical protein